MIRILFFIETLTGGGAEKVLRELVNHMDQTKFDITVQTVWPCDVSGLLAPGIRYKSVYSARNRFNRLRYRAEAEGGVLYRLHVKDDYDVECAYLEMGPTKVLAGSTNKKAKKLAWVHCDLSKAMSDSNEYSEKCTGWYKKYHMIVCVSETVKNSFDRIFQNRFRSVVLHNYINDAEVREKAEESVLSLEKSQPLLLLAVGTLYPPKNYPRLLRTHRQLKAEGINHELWILGDGQDRNKLEEYVAENDLCDSVRFFGFVDNPYPYMKYADVLACSSNYEGYSTVVTEGLILGKPIVTTDCSGMSELLGDSEYGLITKNDDEAFTEGVRRMLLDKSLREHYADCARRRGFEIAGKNQIREIQDFLSS